MDIVSAGMLLAVLGPFALLGALLIWIAMGRPVFFRQERSGMGGRIFTVIKLRSMLANRQHSPYEPIPLSHPEITTLGRFLRRFKLDEVPQLLCVLTGDMSLIGPRPALPEQVAEYDDFAKQRLQVRPGITGLAQVNGGSSIPWVERIKYDVYYVGHQGVLLDWEIIWKTVAVIFRGEERFVRRFDESSYKVDGSTVYLSTGQATVKEQM